MYIYLTCIYILGMTREISVETLKRLFSKRAFPYHGTPVQSKNPRSLNYKRPPLYYTFYDTHLKKSFDKMCIRKYVIYVNKISIYILSYHSYSATNSRERNMNCYCDDRFFMCQIYIYIDIYIYSTCELHLMIFIM